MVEENKVEEINNAEELSGTEEKKIYVSRFDAYSRFLHLLVIISFLTLAFTGMIIKFSGVRFFQVLSEFIGGYEVSGFLHRVGAIMTVTYFVLHLFNIISKMKNRTRSFKYMFSGENSMVPNKTDLKELIGTFKWFLGMGPRPEYGRWTYWEKFDYFAVFWGVMIIGLSGLMLWFPEIFTMLGIPGWFINVATIIHSDEALLATGFIFTVHFFNTHFRPDKFPMDTVIFTGSVELEEFKEDRPRQYKQLVKDGELENMYVDPPNPKFLKIARIFGFTALTLGLLLVISVIISMLFFYT